MEIKVLHLGLIKTNCYLVSTQKAAVVIDPGFIREGTYDFLDQTDSIPTFNDFLHVFHPLRKIVSMQSV